MPKAKPYLPKRAAQHVSETAALRLFRERIPDDWVVRDLSERDYGLDSLVEIPTDGVLTGRVLGAQIKGDAALSLKGRETIGVSSVSRGTYNYLLRLPMPTYLFVCSATDRQVYWASLRAHRRDVAPRAGPPRISLDRWQNLSRFGQLSLMRSHALEQAWPQVEAAIVGALTAFNGLGPLYLGCKRSPPGEPVPTMVQFLVTQHHEFNRVLHRYKVGVGAKRFPSLRKLHAQARSAGGVTSRGVFTYEQARAVLASFIGDYIVLVREAFEQVTQVQRAYWSERHPYLVTQLDLFAPGFNDEDWFSRYYFDEYESDTAHVMLTAFEDLDEGVLRDLSGDQA